MPTSFPEYCVKGLKLKKSIEAISQAKEFEQDLKNNGLENILGWLSDWCYANYYYRQKDNANANVFTKDRFQKRNILREKTNIS